MGCGASTVQSVAEPALSGKTTAIDPPSQQELYDAARSANAKQVQMMLAAGAAPDALFRGIAISRGIVVPAAA